MTFKDHYLILLMLSFVSLSCSHNEQDSVDTLSESTIGFDFRIIDTGLNLITVSIIVLGTQNKKDDASLVVAHTLGIVGAESIKPIFDIRPMQNKISIFLVREQNLFPFSIIDVVT
jgi:hypothetical protein